MMVQKLQEKGEIPEAGHYTEANKEASKKRKADDADAAAAEVRLTCLSCMRCTDFLSQPTNATTYTKLFMCCTSFHKLFSPVHMVHSQSAGTQLCVLFC